jgi:hypothetical protein
MELRLAAFDFYGEGPLAVVLPPKLDEIGDACETKSS